MGLISNIAEIVRDLLIFVAVMMALFILFIVVVSKMPNDNPLKRLLTALTYRVGATLAASLVAIPIEPIPLIDALYDIAVPIALIWYWFTFLRDAGGMMRSPSEPASVPPPYQSIPRTDVIGRRASDLRRIKGDPLPRRSGDRPRAK